MPSYQELAIFTVEIPAAGRPLPSLGEGADFSLPAIPGVDASSSGKSRQEKKARARNFQNRFKQTPPSVQPDQSAQPDRPTQPVKNR